MRPEGPVGGTVEVVIGTQSAGQGHETSFAQVAAEGLGLDVEAIRIVAGDTDLVGFGGGTHSGRSMRMAGAVIALAADDLIAEGKHRAAQALEAAPDDMTYTRARFTVAGTDRGIGLFEIPGGLAVVRDNEMHEIVFPNGCHVCEVEVDPETGAVELVRYAAVDDVGRAINPLIVEGQTHGGIVQGVGQAIHEACVIDRATGQTLTGTLMDYAVPRADDVPSFTTRGRYHACAGRGHQRHRRCAPAARRHRGSPAGDAARHLASDPRRTKLAYLVKRRLRPARPATTRTLRGAASQMANADSAEPPMAIQKAGV